MDAEAWSRFPVDQRFGAFPPSGDGSYLVFAGTYLSPLNNYERINSVLPTALQPSPAAETATSPKGRGDEREVRH